MADRCTRRLDVEFDLYSICDCPVHAPDITIDTDIILMVLQTLLMVLLPVEQESFTLHLRSWEQTEEPRGNPHKPIT